MRAGLERLTALVAITSTLSDIASAIDLIAHLVQFPPTPLNQMDVTLVRRIAPRRLGEDEEM